MSWPTREQWSRSRRELQPGHVPQPSREVQRYLSPAEVEKWIQAARGRWSDLGREMKRADEEQREGLRERRQRIRLAVENINDGVVTFYALLVGDQYHGDRSALKILSQRYYAEERRLVEEAEKAAARTPVGDDEWQAELKRRRAFDCQPVGQIAERLVQKMEGRR